MKALMKEISELCNKLDTKLDLFEYNVVNLRQKIADILKTELIFTSVSVSGYDTVNVSFKYAGNGDKWTHYKWVYHDVNGEFSWHSPLLPENKYPDLNKFMLDFLNKDE